MVKRLVKSPPGAAQFMRFVHLYMMASEDKDIIKLTSTILNLCSNRHPMDLTMKESY